MRWAYLVSNFIPILIAFILIWRKGLPSKRTWYLLAILGTLGLINALGENPALHWGIWHYNLPKTLDIQIFGVLFETYVYCIMVPIVIGSAALKFAERQNAKKSKK